MSIEELIVEELEEAVEEIRDNLEATQTNASGKAAASLEVVQYDGGVQLLGCDYFDKIETGTPPHQDDGLTAKIRKWIDNKMKRGWLVLYGDAWDAGDMERRKDWAAARISASIQERGTLLYQDGGRTSIYTEVLNKRVENLQKKVAGLVLLEVKDNILNN